MVADAAGNDAVKMGEIGFDIQRDAMETDRAAHAHADRGDLVVARRHGHPDSDAALAAFALDVELRQRPDQPFLQIVDKGRTSPSRRLRSTIT